MEQLATDVGASRRTVPRDIAALPDLGFVIDTEAGRGGGVRLAPSSVKTTTRLTVGEVFALLLGVAAMRAARTLSFSDLADAGLAKIERSLSPDRVRDLRLVLAERMPRVAPIAHDVQRSAGQSCQAIRRLSAARGLGPDAD